MCQPSLLFVLCLLMVTAAKKNYIYIYIYFVLTHHFVLGFFLFFVFLGFFAFFFIWQDLELFMLKAKPD